MRDIGNFTLHMALATGMAFLLSVQIKEGDFWGSVLTTAFLIANLFFALDIIWFYIKKEG